MTWTGPAFVDAHTHLLATAAHEKWQGLGVSPRDAHLDLKRQGLSPADIQQQYSCENLGNAFEKALWSARDAGIAEIHETGLWNPDYWPALLEMRNQKPLPIRVRVFFTSGLADVRTMQKTGDQSLELLGVKFYADGWLGAETAALQSPYASDLDNDGVLFYETEELIRKMEPFANAGWQLATHAIGDRAIATVLDAYQRLYGDDCAAHAPRIEHAQTLTPDLITRMRELGVVACIQPSFATSDLATARNALGSARMAHAYNWQKLIDGGVRVIAGSDFEIETDDPMRGLSRLITGASDVRKSDEPAAPKLDPHHALAIMTNGEAGTMMLSDDPLAISPDVLDDVGVLECNPVI